MNREVEIKAAVAAEIAREPIRSQDRCCEIAALMAYSYETRPWTDTLIIDVAADMARGLFGPAYEAADYGQRATWNDMCERALRAEISR